MKKKFSWRAVKGAGKSAKTRREKLDRLTADQEREIERGQRKAKSTTEESRERYDRAVRRRQRAPLTPEMASTLALLLHAGVPMEDCVRRIAPRVTDENVPDVVKRWAKAATLADATALLHGGAWETLDKDRRLELSLDKHMAELAHYLIAHEFDTAGGGELSKMNTAREAITSWLDGQERGGDVFEQFMRELMGNKNTGPTMAPVGMAIPIVDPPRLD
jgi:hypothetical protein